MEHPQIIIYAEGWNLDEKKVEAAFENSAEIKLNRRMRTRGGVEDIGNIFKYAADLLENTNKIVDTLLEIIKNHFKGSKVKIQVGGTIIEVENAKRSEIIALIDKAKELHKLSR